MGGTDKAVWLSQSVAVCTAVLAPIFSRGSDLFGRKYFVVGACAAGLVGDIIVSRATSMNMAIAGAAITGISYGAQVGPLRFHLYMRSSSLALLSLWPMLSRPRLYTASTVFRQICLPTS